MKHPLMEVRINVLEIYSTCFFFLQTWNLYCYECIYTGKLNNKPRQSLLFARIIPFSIIKNMHSNFIFEHIRFLHIIIHVHEEPLMLFEMVPSSC